MRRFVSIWLPHWPTDRWRRQNEVRLPAPLVLAARGSGGVRVTAIDAAAAAEGLAPGMTLADARALVPHLTAVEADPAADAQALVRLAEWCRFCTPIVAVDGTDGLLLDVTSCAHLFGGEAELLTVVEGRLARTGLAAALALADTPAAAWAWARFRPRKAGALLPTASRDSLGALPVAALRLPDGLAGDLARVGLHRVRDLANLPRAPLVARYGAVVGIRLDRMFGDAPEPVAAQRPPSRWRSRLPLAEPIARREDIEAALARLLDDLCRALEKAGRGARRLRLLLFRVDATFQEVAVGTSRPSREPEHLARLFRERLDGVDPGFGIELLLLDAPETGPLSPRQEALTAGGIGGGADADDLGRLLDRLRARMGDQAVLRPMRWDSHIPERATLLRPVQDASPATLPSAGPPAGEEPYSEGALRPVLLLERPEPVEVSALVDGAPPISFLWRGRRHVVGLLEGPERLAPEWWREPHAPECRADGVEAGSRDYYRIEDIEGQRFWLFRLFGTRVRADWYLHGLFA